MANPIKSVVVKTAGQSPIQKALIASQKAKPNLGHPTAPGFTSSGPGAPWTSPSYKQTGSVLRGGPGVKVNANGQAVSPIGDSIANLQTKAKPLPAAPVRPKVKVSIQPDGTVTVNHAHVTPQPYTGDGAPAATLPDTGTGVHIPGVTNGSVPRTPQPGPATDGAHPKMSVKPRTTASATSSVSAPSVAPSDQSTATSAINAILAPVIKQITDAAAARSAQGQQAIGGYTTNALNQLKGLDFSTPYAGAASGENAINTALLARLTGQGSALQDQLGSKLAGIGDPGTAGETAMVGNTANGAANAGLANGDATLAQLLSEGAAAKTYGKKLPGITSLAGAQDIAKNQGQVTADENTQLSDLQSKVPGMVQSELTALQNARTSAEKNRIAAAIAEGYDPSTGQLTPKARAALASATGTDPVTGQPTAKTQLGFQKADAAAAKNALSKGKANASVSKELGYLSDDHGNPILRNGKTIPVATTGSKGFKITSSLAKTLSTDAETYYGGIAPKYVPGSGGQVQPGTGPGTQLFYQDAVSRLKATAIAAGMDQKQAVKLATAIANSYYKPGEGGRPTFTPKQQAANSALFPQTILGG